MRKGFAGQLANRNFTSVFGDRTSFRATRFNFTSRDNLEITILHFWRSNLISCERVRGTTCKSQFYDSFWRSNLISCERVARDDLQFFGDRSSFRAKGVAFRGLIGTAPCLRERNRIIELEKKERAKGQAAREQEGKREM